MHFIYPNYLKPDDAHTDDAARVWKGIFNMLDCDERAKFRFRQNYFNI